MTRTYFLLSAAVAITLAGAGSASADQFTASAGLTAEAAQGMTVTDIAQHKFNRDLSYSDRQVVSIPPVNGSAGRSQLAARAGVAPETARSMSLTALAVAKFNNESRRDDRQGVVPSTRTTLVSRSVVGPSNAHRQLAASAGLSPAEAEGMTVAEIARYKFNRDESTSDKQRTSN